VGQRSRPPLKTLLKETLDHGGSDAVERQTFRGGVAIMVTSSLASNKKRGYGAPDPAAAERRSVPDEQKTTR